MGARFRLPDWTRQPGTGAWRSLAACRGMPITLFFGPESKNAKAMCDGCKVTEECLEFGVALEEELRWRSGVYGNTTARERDVMFGKLQSHAPIHLED